MKSPQPMPAWLVPDWPAPPQVRALSTIRVAGANRDPFAGFNVSDRVEDAPMAVAKNRRTLREAAGLPAEPTWLRQVHGSQVLDLDALQAGHGEMTPTKTKLGGTESAEGLPCDAAVTGRAGAVCAILTADCLPVLLAARSGAQVGAAHAGWRGLAAGVIEATVAAMAAAGSPPGEILAWLGPAIGPEHFEVGPEVREELLRGDPQAQAAFLENSRGRFMADLFALARRRLRQAGVEQIYGGGQCTYSQPEKFFSHRRDGRTGRQATLIWLG